MRALVISDTHFGAWTDLAYLRNGWPGTAILIDSDEPEPRLLRLREHLNPLHSMPDGR